jgi:hypothetical protein
MQFLKICSADAFGLSKPRRPAKKPARAASAVVKG